MALNNDTALCGQVTVWHFLAEDTAGGAIWHPVLYDAAVVLAEQASEVRMTRHSAAQMQGFLFPTGHLLPVTPAVGRDCIASGDHTAYETPAQAQAAGAAVCRFTEVIRPPRMRSGTLVEWVQFSADTVV